MINSTTKIITNHFAIKNEYPNITPNPKPPAIKAITKKTIYPY